VDVWQWVLLPTVIVLGLIFGLPLGALISVSFHESTGPATASEDFTLGNYATFVEDPVFLGHYASEVVDEPEGREYEIGARHHRGPPSPSVAFSAP
jgi:hypothetical protein